MKTPRKPASQKRQGVPKDVRVPKLGKDIGFLLCARDADGGHTGLDDGDFLVVLCGNSKGFRKLGNYFLGLAGLDTSNDPAFHHHFFAVRSLSKTKIELMVRKNRAAHLYDKSYYEKG